MCCKEEILESPQEHLAKKKAPKNGDAASRYGGSRFVGGGELKLFSRGGAHLHICYFLEGGQVHLSSRKVCFFFW